MLILFSVINSYSQENHTFEKHIGINTFFLKYFSEDTISDGYKPFLLNGISFKKDYRHITLRSSLNFNRYKAEFKNSFPDGYEGFFYYSILSISVGLQGNIEYKKLSCFYGLDLFSNLSLIRQDLIGGYSGEQHANDIYYHQWLGISPFLGLQYNFTKRFSVSIETSYNLIHRIINSDTSDKRSAPKFQYYYNPINTLSVFYSF